MPDYSKDKPLSPAKAIRQKCLECVGYEPSEVRDCTITPDKCRLYPYRLGKGCDRGREANPPTRTRAMREECILCMNGQAHFVKDCPSTSCAIWPYRMGRGICQDPTGNTIKPRRNVQPTPEHLQALREGYKSARRQEEIGQDGEKSPEARQSHEGDRP